MARLQPGARVNAYHPGLKVRKIGIVVSNGTKIQFADGNKYRNSKCEPITGAQLYKKG